ncbi:hypothetical protein FC36_GL001106 [Ligilactobacillus equi DSM 15833 = JCM 10991]|uniref:Uncharacterized protein n=1 Tax=Ligilactobacillus equi DSM 15833 = JCM 10991 TaxID=1423740 RepID=A0A0R1TAA9_9LACO|nr:hypothetical protein FC36_GL001106 [Ligilactobacillus equi DSM 15833 = JCM 10991]
MLAASSALALTETKKVPKATAAPVATPLYALLSFKVRFFLTILFFIKFYSPFQ